MCTHDDKIVITKKCLQDSAVFSPPYVREVWHFKKANIDHIGKAISGFQWENFFQNMNFNDMVHFI